MKILPAWLAEYDYWSWFSEWLDYSGGRLEGTVRGAFLHGGRSVDVLIYSLLRDDLAAWRKSD